MYLLMMNVNAKRGFFDDLYRNISDGDSDTETHPAQQLAVEETPLKPIAFLKPVSSPNQEDSPTLTCFRKGRSAKREPLRALYESSSKVSSDIMSDSIVMEEAHGYSVKSPNRVTADCVLREPTEAPKAVPGHLTKDEKLSSIGKKRLPWIEEQKKTKRPKGKKLVPAPSKAAEHLMVFRGLRFYYHPNSDISPARKFRMKKATERGATRVTTFDSTVSHIIVDKGLTYDNLVRHLGSDSLQNNAIIVNDLYPAECIEFGYLIDPYHSRFRVQGQTKDSGHQSLAAATPLTRLSDVQADITTDLIQNSNELINGQNIPSTSCNLPSRSANIRTTKPADQMTLETAIDLTRRAPALSFDTESSSEEEPYPQVEAAEMVEDVQKSWQSQFQCMHGSSRNDETPNRRTIEVLEQMCDYYERTGDTWRTMGYRKAMIALRRAPYIATLAQAQALPGIGPRLAAKIEEIAQTNCLQRLEHAQADPAYAALQLFTGIYGAGPKQAHAWLAAGYRTLADLRAHPAALTVTQRIGLERHADFAARIPHTEVARHGALVAEALAALEPRARITIGGSFRRGAATSGDIDLLIIGPEAALASAVATLVFDRLVPALFAAGYLQCALASTSHGSKWHGAACLPDQSIWRRIDLLVVPAAEEGAACLYFTGNDIFNRSMRLLARRCGMRLNQRGLWQVNGRPDLRPAADEDRRNAVLEAAAEMRKDIKSGANAVRPTALTNSETETALASCTDAGLRHAMGSGASTLLEAQSEERIFSILGMPWREPHERNC